MGELTEEEKQLWYRKSPNSDLSERVLGRSYARFSIPSADEGFDEIRFVWEPKDKCEPFLRDWILNLKKTQKIEDLEPGEWFKEQNEFKDPVKRKQAQKRKEEELNKKQQEEGADDA